MSKEEELHKIENIIEDLSREINQKFLGEKELARQIELIQNEVKKRIEGLNDQRLQIQTETFHKRRQIRELNAKREMLARQAEEEARNKSLLDNYHSLQEKLELIKGNFSWSDKIMNHQTDGAEFIALKKRTLLCDVMGLGKTLTTISALDFIQEATKDASPTNIFITDPLDRFPVKSPAGRKVLYLSSAELSYGVWEEFKKWAPHRNVIFLTGFSKAVRRVVIDNLKHMANEYVVIMNYEGWRKDLNLLPILSELKFDTIIFDEAHKLKEGERNIGYRGTASLMSGTPSPYRIGLTGTPILNRPQELFPQLALLDPYMFYSLNQFLDEYCEQVEDDSGKKRWTFKPGGIDLLYRKIGPIILRRTKKDAGIVLPPQTIIHHDIEIDPELYPKQARAREEMRRWGSIQLDPDNSEKGHVSAAAQIAVLTRLRQIEAWPHNMRFKNPQSIEEIEANIEPTYTYLDCEESQKLDYILNPIFDMGLATEAIQSGEKVVVFSQFTKALEELERRFITHGYKPALFTGNTHRNTREEIKRQFDASRCKSDDMTYDVVLANYKVGGEGVNFTNASQTIIDDEEWNPGKRDQGYGRTDRIGQQLPTTVHVVRVKETVDDWLASLIDFKEDLVGGFETTFSTNAAFEALKEGKI